MKESCWSFFISIFPCVGSRIYSYFKHCFYTFTNSVSFFKFSGSKIQAVYCSHGDKQGSESHSFVVSSNYSEWDEAPDYLVDHLGSFSQTPDARYTSRTIKAKRCKWCPGRGRGIMQQHCLGIRVHGYFLGHEIRPCVGITSTFSQMVSHLMHTTSYVVGLTLSVLQTRRLRFQWTCRYHTECVTQGPKSKEKLDLPERDPFPVPWTSLQGAQRGPHGPSLRSTGEGCPPPLSEPCGSEWAWN